MSPQYVNFVTESAWFSHINELSLYAENRILFIHNHIRQNICHQHHFLTCRKAALTEKYIFITPSWNRIPASALAQAPGSVLQGRHR